MLDALSVVNAPVLGVVLPMPGGDARYVLNPAPLTVLDALSVVNAPVDVVVAPICVAFKPVLVKLPTVVPTTPTLNVSNKWLYDRYDRSGVVELLK